MRGDADLATLVDSLSDDELRLAMDLLYLDRWGNRAAQRNHVRSLYRWQL